ncbi:MAG: hypothetical protein H6964_04790 [Chromatiaceae bacterium]|nr:hypothetical protein [Chromatiaceae bacterium]
MAADKAEGVSNPVPPYRRLQIFSLDPAVDIELDKALISRSVIQVPWENLSPGPVGEYLEVIDVDPASNCIYDPIDLSGTLAVDGRDPSTGNPQFHQQMVYAVAALTINNFERILGRRVLWAERYWDENGEHLDSFDPRRFVQRLRIYPHALRDQNAYYSPAKKALLFGYFNAPAVDPRQELPGGMVFTCLSHDIIAHETTHAILDGIHRRLLKPSNPDMLAFHEAFADIVAIFQHFSIPGLLLDQIQRTRGDLDHDNLLARLATQFARSTGRGNALRNALGNMDEDGHRLPPDPSALGRAHEPHERGAILVAAVYDAFFRIYKERVADLRRIATNGTGVLPAGEIHPDLAKRFADEATHAANRVLTVCIRAVDYLPAVDIDFGDYLRALITSDFDLVPEDPLRYRLAFIEAFRNHGIYPVDVRTLAEDSLRWHRIAEQEQRQFEKYLPSAGVLRTMAYAYESGKLDGWMLLSESNEYLNLLDQGKFKDAEKSFLRLVWLDERPEGKRAEGKPEQGVDRRNRHMLGKAFAIFLRRWITRRALNEESPMVRKVESFLGIDLRTKGNRAEGIGPLEVHAVRPTVRIVPGGRTRTQLLIVLTQWREENLINAHGEQVVDSIHGGLTFKYRSGCTLIIDPELGMVEYAISKSLESEARKRRQMNFLCAQVAQFGHLAVERLKLKANLRPVGRRDMSAEAFEPLAMIHHGASADGEY